MSVIDNLYKLDLNQSNMNLNIEYPYSDMYEYSTQLVRFDLDKRREEDIKNGRGFIISEPNGIKKDLKNQDGIYSWRFGSNSITDVDSFNGSYRCNCGLLRGSIRHGEWCDNCNSKVKNVGDDVGIAGYLVLKEPYYIIHPNIYSTLEGFIGASRLNRIIKTKIEVNSDGKPIIIAPKKDEPFFGVGLMEFKECYDEILNYYLKKYPQKQMYYDSLMKVRDFTFTRSIRIYSSLLRPSRLDDGSLKYETCNDQFSMLSSLVYRCNRDKLHIDRMMKEKLEILYDIQDQLNKLYFKIKEILAKKKGDIRSAIGGRYAFSSRSVIRQDIILKSNQIKLSYYCLCELLQQVIINILTRSYNITYAEAYKKWYKASISDNIDEVIYNIIDGLIKDSSEGLPILINRNPTIAYGGVLFMRCIGINTDYTMSISLLSTVPLKADFDGDTLNILYLYNKEFIKAVEVLSPLSMFISRNDGMCNPAMIFGGDIIINANTLKTIGSYNNEEIERIRVLQSYNS